MNTQSLSAGARKLASEYGILLVLLALSAFFSVATYKPQFPTGTSAGQQLNRRIVNEFDEQASVYVLGPVTDEGNAFASALETGLHDRQFERITVVQGDPVAMRNALQAAANNGQTIDVVACSEGTAKLRFLRELPHLIPEHREAKVLVPTSYMWPDFLKASNLRAVANRIAVIAIIAIGMTMVIITAGIDLSVGSLIAFSAVVAAWLIRSASLPPMIVPLPPTLVVAWHLTVGLALIVFGCVWFASGRTLAGCLSLLAGLTMPYVIWLVAMGCVRILPALGAGAVGMTVSCIIAILLCALVGAFSGSMVAFFHIPPFIVTLAMMLLASGAAYMIAQNESIYQLPDSFTWLGRGFWLGIPNAVLLMLVLYSVAHVMMTRTVLGRYIYAVGGNPEAARLSGVPVRPVVLFCYCACGALAGVGGIIRASELKSGAPTYGLMAELDVIAAVVVGGTSLAGGEGRILGTLIGALIIAVIRNGMNLTNIESNEQKVVLGMVILAAVLLDLLKKQGWTRRKKPAASA